MAVRLRTVLRHVGWVEKVFLLLLALAVATKYAAPGGGAELLLAFMAFVAGATVALRWAAIGIRKLIWRLRYRLVVAYLFIAVIPIVLMAILVWIGAGMFTGQIAAYLVTTELERRTTELFEPARGLAWTAPDQRSERARWLAPYFWDRFPGFELLIRDDTTWRYPENATINAPPEAWRDVSGLVLKDHSLYIWAHAIHESTEVTMLAPVTPQSLSSLVPGIGQLALREFNLRALVPPDPNAVPPPVNAVDLQVSHMVPITVAIWDSPGQTENIGLRVVTRYSAVLRTIFGEQGEWRKGLTAASYFGWLFSLLAVLFLLVELVSVVIGIRLTRSITRAVHELYLGTQRVREGDFSHRIEVRGNDQLAELGDSFNRMTENLERLVEVAKEKERLQSEIEIAREVQNQLFPKSTPESNTILITAACAPARLVSGDYYDYLNLEESKIALAIGDVAGKGISAALLMATVQSTMRTQLRAGRELAAAVAGNGGQVNSPSTASLVSRLNQQLFTYTPPEKFATFYFALYDDETGWMRYTNAGHVPPILVHKGIPARLDVTGTVVGAFSFSQYGESAVRLEPGDLLVCFTDGITEPENEFGEMYGEDRLTDLVVKNAERDSNEIVRAIMDSVREWTGSPELQDDMTLLLARRI